MRIFIESGALYGNRSGVGRYALNISQALSKLRTEDQFIYFSFLKLGRKPVVDFKIEDNTRIALIRWFPGRLFSLLMRNGLSLPIELFGLGIRRGDVVLFPNFISWASFRRNKKISVVHDIAFMKYPEFTQEKNLRYLKKQLHKSLKRSTAVIAVSDATKQDLINQFGVHESKIHVVHNAVDALRFKPQPKDRVADVKKKFKLGKYILFVGNIEPRKNLEGVIKAHTKSYRYHGLELIIAGARGWNNSEIYDLVDENPSVPVRFLDYVPDDDLPALYSGAEFLVFPSHYEGFGLPAIEAMSAGCPVICSNNSSFPEVAGDAALTVDPNDVDQISNAIIKLSKDVALRHNLVKKGLIQAKKFSWSKSATVLSALIDDVCEPDKANDK